MDEELREHVRAVRSGLRAADRDLRHLRQLLAALDERLERAPAAQPEEAQRGNGNPSHSSIRVTVA